MSNEVIAEGEYHESTPLDLLLNAISGSDDYHYPRQDGHQDGEGSGDENLDPQLSLGGFMEASRAAVRSVLAKKCANLTTIASDP